MFLPFKAFLDITMTKTTDKKRKDAFMLILLFSSALLVGHIASCGWIYLGTMQDGWLSSFVVNDAQFKTYEPYQVYIFTNYWVFTVLTTVGYGDYAGTNTDEFIYSICLQIVGLSFFALLTGLITPLVTPEKDFAAMLMEKSDSLDLWINKLQHANSTVSKVYIPATLYIAISETVQEAFKNDHNLIIEEFSFY